MPEKFKPFMKFADTPYNKNLLTELFTLYTAYQTLDSLPDEAVIEFYDSVGTMFRGLPLNKLDLKYVDISSSPPGESEVHKQIGLFEDKEKK